MAVKKHTYFIQAEDGGPIKIGFTSTSPEVRLKALQTGSPVKLKLLAATNDNREHELHEKFSSLRIHGEWFRNEEPLLKYIEELRKSLTPERAEIALTPETLRELRTDLLFDVKFDLHDRHKIYDFVEWVEHKDRDWGAADDIDYNPFDDDELDEDEQSEYYHTHFPTGIMSEIAWLMNEATFFEDVWISTELYEIVIKCGPCNSNRRFDLLSCLASHTFDLDCSASPWHIVASTWIEGKPEGVELAMSHYGNFVLFNMEEHLAALAKRQPTQDGANRVQP